MYLAIVNQYLIKLSLLCLWGNLTQIQHYPSAYHCIKIQIFQNIVWFVIYIPTFSDVDSPFVSNYLLLFSLTSSCPHFLSSLTLYYLSLSLHWRSSPTSVLSSVGLSLWQQRCAGVDRSTDNAVQCFLSANT